MSSSKKELATLYGLASKVDLLANKWDLGSEKEAWRRLASCSSSEARTLVPLELAERFCVLPLAVVSQSAHLSIFTAVFPEPFDLDIFQQLRFVVNMEIEAECYHREVIMRAIQAAYRQDRSILDSALEKSKSAVCKSLNNYSENAEVRAVTDSPIPKLLETIIDRGIALGASDVHFDPTEERTAIVRYRIDGILRTESDFFLNPLIAKNIARRIKVLAGLDITNDVTPQDGGFSFSTVGSQYRIRVSLVSTVNGEKIVLRLLDQAAFVSDFDSSDSRSFFSSLGLTDEQSDMLRSHLVVGGGTIISSGPTGSGKSTLLHRALIYLKQKPLNIITIEEPVERKISGVNQVEVCADKGLGYAQLLGKLLRQDPDILMVGEIRDEQTAHLALTAGITGHLVLSTVHCSSCIEVFQRLRQLGVPLDLMLTSLKLVINQRLIARSCADCAVRIKPSPVLGRIFELDSNILVVSKCLGCRNCQYTGVIGRLGVFELLPLTAAIKNFLCQESMSQGGAVALKDYGGFNSLRRLAFSEGYRPYAYQVRDALSRELISQCAALEAIGISPEILEMSGN
ncbi:MAG: type II/IV secretion system protein [Deltaproteobacteria bacterium]|nr:type II/IV secretion system protein [Deltaproteobacteria bacterium]